MRSPICGASQYSALVGSGHVAKRGLLCQPISSDLDNTGITLAIWQARCGIAASIMTVQAQTTNVETQPKDNETSVREGMLEEQWNAVRDAAGAVAMLAGIAHDEAPTQEAEFSALVQRQTEWKLALAEQGVADLAAIMQPGVQALLSIHAAGQSAQAPAQILWNQFALARDGLLTLIEEPVSSKE